MSVLAAVERDLTAIRATHSALADGTLAATARALAAELDGDNSATSKSMCAARLVEIMTQLRELAPEAREVNPLDEIRARRDARKTNTENRKRPA